MFSYALWWRQYITFLSYKINLSIVPFLDYFLFLKCSYFYLVRILPTTWLDHYSFGNCRLGGLPARSYSGDRLFLFIGIIDILQSYRMVKKMEHTLKAVVIDAVSLHCTLSQLNCHSPFACFLKWYQSFDDYRRKLSIYIK